MLHFIDRILLVVFFLYLQVSVLVRIAGPRLTWVPRAVGSKDACEDDLRCRPGRCGGPGRLGCYFRGDLEEHSR